MPPRKVREQSVQYKAESKSPFDIKERTFLFGVRVVKLVGRLPRNVAGLEIGRQLIRAGTSVGANVEEAQSGESKRDFVHKMGIAAKEAREAREKRDAGKGYLYQIDLGEERNFILPIPSEMRR